MLSDKFFLNVAELIAKESKCISLQVGAVIVKDNRIISMGYNGTVAGSINCCDYYQQHKNDKDYNHSDWSSANEIHAEMNAIMFAVKTGISINGAILYCTHEPCDQCLKNIIQAGIAKVIYKNKYQKDKCKSSYRNIDDHSIELVHYTEIIKIEVPFLTILDAKSNKTFKISVGDYYLNKYGQKVKVTNIIKYTENNNIKFIIIIEDNFKNSTSYASSIFIKTHKHI